MTGRFNLPLVLDGAAIEALVVGGGAVATRKVLALVAGGATVRVRAPRISDELTRRATADDRILIEPAVYDDEAIGDAMLVLAATDDRAVNARIADDARRARRLVLVADDADAGSFTMPAVYRCGELLVSVTSGGVPGVSTRVRGEIARRFDDRYAAAIRDLSRLRARLLAADDRAAWRAAATALLADDFCDAVESGTFRERLAAWL